MLIAKDPLHYVACFTVLHGKKAADNTETILCNIKMAKSNATYRTIHSAVPSNISAVAMPVNRATVAAQ